MRRRGPALQLRTGAWDAVVSRPSANVLSPCWARACPGERALPVWQARIARSGSGKAQGGQAASRWHACGGLHIGTTLTFAAVESFHQKLVLSLSNNSDAERLTLYTSACGPGQQPEDVAQRRRLAAARGLCCWRSTWATASDATGPPASHHTPPPYTSRRCFGTGPVERMPALRPRRAARKSSFAFSGSVFRWWRLIGWRTQRRGTTPRALNCAPRCAQRGQFLFNGTLVLALQVTAARQCRGGNLSNCAKMPTRSDVSGRTLLRCTCSEARFGDGVDGAFSCIRGEVSGC